MKKCLYCGKEFENKKHKECVYCCKSCSIRYTQKSIEIAEVKKFGMLKYIDEKMYFY